MKFSVSLQEIFISFQTLSFDLQNYGPEMLQNSLNYGYESFGQNGMSLSDEIRDTFPPELSFPSPWHYHDED